MKFLTSSSSSASSTITTTTTTATSFEGNVSNSRGATAGCISGVFRRLLCLNSLPTHPSDELKDTDHDSVSVEFDKLQCTKAEERVEASAAPSIVARLMGLESLPQIEFSAHQKSLNSIARSRSMNSVDLMKELVSIQDRHRRVKSFRETSPTFLELEDEDFFILSFENGNERRKLGVKSNKSERGSGQMKQSSKGDNCKTKNNKRRESVYEKNKENIQETMNVSNQMLEERTVSSRKASQMVSCDGKPTDSSNILRPKKNSCQNSLVEKEMVKLAKPINQKPESEVARRRMKKRKDDSLPVKKIETESDSQNSSPSSVLDIMKFPSDPEVTSSEDLPRWTNSKSRRTLTEDLQNYRKLNQQSHKSLTSNASCRSRSSESKCVESKKNGHSSYRYVEIWGEISKMAERDTIQSNWILNKRIQQFEDYKKISGEFEMQILDGLLGELVNQLLGD